MLKKELIDYIRHLSLNDKKTLSQKALKACEEIGELAKCVLPYDNAASTTHRFVDRSKILEEVCDTILTVLSIAYDLKASNEEIEQMINHKTKKWADLQARDEKINYPVPYEIHVTVAMDGASFDDFKYDCNNLGVKPIVLDLHTKNEVIKDMMTSSVHIGNNRSAYQELSRIVDGLEIKHYKVLRQKIETIPWHPAAPSIKHHQPKMPPNCYFECHLNVITTNDRLNDLTKIATAFGAKKSRNIFKKLDDIQLAIMVTYRSYDKVYEEFQKHLNKLKVSLAENDFKVEKEIVEFSIYDTKLSHDIRWILDN